MTRLEWTEPAVADLENIQNYIEKDSVEYADALLLAVAHGARNLAGMKSKP
jgi:plasmid stabilization system protein ParE